MTAAVATTERTRLETLQEQEVKLAQQVEQLREKIATYPDRIAKERESAWYAKPSKRPLAQLNSPLQKLLDAEKGDVATLNGLQQDLSAVRNVIQQEDVRVREQETASARAQTQELHAKEEAIWKEAGELFGELANVWNTYVDLAEEEDRFATASGLDGSGALAVVPAPLSFKSFLLLLHRAATDSEVRLEPYEEQLIDAGAFRTEHGGVGYDVRPAGTRQIEVRRKLDYGDRLIYVLPDLRSVVHKLQLSGRIPIIAE
jgi:DNA repair exonuclease SbcCD ATPase subunit